MRRLYSTRFTIDPSAPNERPRLETVASSCLRWSVPRGGLEGAIDFPLALQKPLQPIPLVKTGGSRLETIFLEEDSTTEWGMKFSHLDTQDPNIRWTIEVALRRDPKGSIDFVCLVYVSREGLVIAPIEREPCSPKIVREILQFFPCRVDKRLRVRSKAVLPEETLPFVDFLLDPYRQLPVVFLSAQNFADRPCVDPDKIAEWAGGLAHTLHATSRFTTLFLEDQHGLPHHLNAWDGAIRLYWPAFQYSDSPSRHPCWLPSWLEVMSLAEIRREILRPISVAAATTFDRSAPSWPALERKHRTQRFKKEGIEAIEAATFYEECAESFEAERNQIEAERDQIRSLLDDANNTIFQKNHEIESLRSSLVYLKSQGPSQPELEPPNSLEEAVNRAKQLYAKELIFALNGASYVRKNPFERPVEALSALQYLAKEWRAARQDPQSRDNHDTRLREFCGWSYRPSQSKDTMKRFKSEYTTDVDGETHWLGHHLCSRSVKDPKHSLRIAFSWDERSGKVVIGYIGQHQKTKAT